MTHEKSTIEAQFKSDDSARRGILDRARLCAALSKPWILPDAGHDATDELPENYQSVGSRGTTNIVGRMLLAMFPANQLWFHLRPTGAIRYDATIDPRIIEVIEQQLFLNELQIQATLESADLKGGSRKRRSSFRSRKRMALDQIFVTGDALEMLTGDYRLKTFRRDQYVTKRDSSGDVLYHIIKEQLDPLSLSEDHRRKAGLSDAELEAQPVAERVTDIHTHVEWQPLGKNWVVKQEMDKKVFIESQEPVTPFFSTPFELEPAGDYGRGFIELNLGDLRSLDNLEERILDFAAFASKHLLFKNTTSQVKDTDLMKETGRVVEGAVVKNGQVQDIAFFSADKVNDFNVVRAAKQDKEASLNKAFLMESEIQPNQDRVTRAMVQRIAAEVDGALGGVYAPIADEQQIPLLQRTIHQLERDNLIVPLPDHLVEIEALTGLAALSREIDASRVLEFTQVVAQLGPQAMRRIDEGVLVNLLARLKSIDERGLVKTDEQVAQEDQAAMQQQMLQQAAGKAVDTIGNVAEKNLTLAQPAA